MCVSSKCSVAEKSLAQKLLAPEASALSLSLLLLPLLQLVPTDPCIAALGFLGLLLLWRQQCCKGKTTLVAIAKEEVKEKRTSEAVEDPIRWSFMPSTGALRANTEKPVESANDLADLKFLVLHRPTHEAWREKEGNYPYSWHFSGRKRVWEVRVQVQFKRRPSGAIYFGLEMRHGGGSTQGAAKQLKNMLLRMVRASIGDEFYQTAGEDPKTTQGEAEPPTFAMPLWVVDQFIVSNSREEAPELSSDLNGLGARRTDGLKKYIAALRDEMEALSPEKVYTFCFWGVSQFVDVMKWEIRGLGFRMDANKLCGAPPVFVVAYELDKPEAEAPDTRHLISQKRYYFKVALWSERSPPEPEFLSELLGSAQAAAPRPALCNKAEEGASRLSQLREAGRRWRQRAAARRQRAWRAFGSVVGDCGAIIAR